ncbi:MAG: hypothetical protein U9Q78_02925 [Chloroflexota bacterium]|nr:hypothetical protein [Chloroflexota bacterium]
MKHQQRLIGLLLILPLLFPSVMTEAFLSPPAVGLSSQGSVGGFDTKDVELTGHLSGGSGFIAVQGDYAYEGFGSELAILDYTGAQPFSCDTVTEIPQMECEALVALYNSTDGVNWNHKSGWLDTSTPCSWYGVKCQGGHVTELNMLNNHLAGTMPSELGN